jgi:putative membrane protein
MSSDAELTLAPRRLHPAGIAVLGVASLRDLALPLGVAFLTTVLGAGGGGEPLLRVIGFGVLGALIAVAAGVARWMTTTWAVAGGVIRHRSGVVSKRETDVPLSRVQAIDTVHGPLQRVFGVRGVHVQTAGGGHEGEIMLPAVTPADVAALRAAVDGRGGLREAPAPLAERRLSGRDQLLAALTAGQLGVILPLLAAVAQIAQEVFGNDLRSTGEEGLRFVPDSALEWIAAAAAVLALGWLVAIAGAVLTFAGFAVARDEHRLRVRRGLFARREATVPVARIQAVQLVEGVLRQPFGLAALRIEVAGYAAEEAAARTLFPLVRRAEADALLASLLPELAGAAGPALAPAPRRALRRYALPPAAAALAVGAITAAAIPGAGPWPLLIVLPAAAWGAECWRAAGWRLAEGRVHLRFRRMARITVLAPVSRLQQHGLRQTVLQRRARLADVTARVGAGTRGHVRHLDAAVAGGLFDALRDPEAVEQRVVRAP